MAVKIRLTRKGKKKQPSYRVVVADSRAPRDGRYIEQIGRYDPLKDPSEIVIDNERAGYWLSVGAQPSDAVRKLLEISGAIGARTPKDPKVHVVGEDAQRAAAEAEAAAAAEVAEAEADEEPAATEAPEEAPPAAAEAADEEAAAVDEEEQS